MNAQALFDALLAATAAWVAWQAVRAPAVRLACALLAGLQPGDLLHLGMAAGLALLGVWINRPSA